MEWYQARIGDPVAMRALMDALADELRRARMAERLAREAQIFVVTEADAVCFHFNSPAMQVCPSLQRFGLPADRAPNASERINPLIDERQGREER